MSTPTRLTPATLPLLASSIDTFLFDCDGVLWRGGVGVPGVGEVIAELEALGKRCFFVTNNSTKTREEYVKVLAATAGITAPASRVISSAFAAALYLRDAGFRGRRVYVCGSRALVHELETHAGVECVGGDEDAARDFSFGVHAPSELDPAVGAVVMGFDARFSYFKLHRAASYLRYGGTADAPVAFIATNRDTSYPDAFQLCPGAGSLVAALVAGSGRSPDVVAGKPDATLIALVLAATGADPSRTCMVGDRLDTDILFGARAGYAARLLVLTGVTKEEELGKLGADDPLMPTHIVASLGDLAPWLREARADVGVGGAGAPGH